MLRKPQNQATSPELVAHHPGGSPAQKAPGQTAGEQHPEGSGGASWNNPGSPPLPSSPSLAAGSASPIASLHLEDDLEMQPVAASPAPGASFPAGALWGRPPQPPTPAPTSTSSTVQRKSAAAAGAAQPAVPYSGGLWSRSAGGLQGAAAQQRPGAADYSRAVPPPDRGSLWSRAGVEDAAGGSGSQAAAGAGQGITGGTMGPGLQQSGWSPAAGEAGPNMSAAWQQQQQQQQSAFQAAPTVEEAAGWGGWRGGPGAEGPSSTAQSNLPAAPLSSGHRASPLQPAPLTSQPFATHSEAPSPSGQPATPAFPQSLAAASFSPSSPTNAQHPAQEDEPLLAASFPGSGLGAAGSSVGTQEKDVRAKGPSGGGPGWHWLLQHRLRAWWARMGQSQAWQVVGAVASSVFTAPTIACLVGIVVASLKPLQVRCPQCWRCILVAGGVDWAENVPQ